MDWLLFGPLSLGREGGERVGIGGEVPEWRSGLSASILSLPSPPPAACICHPETAMGDRISTCLRVKDERLHPDTCVY